MDIRRHVAVSTVVSLLMLITLKQIQMSAACFLTGILTDLDHVFDFYVNSRRNGKSHYFRRFWDSSRDAYKNGKPFRNVYKFFHSVELLIPVPFLYIFGVWNDIATGILIGFVLHLAMDFCVLGHPGSISLIYKAANGFPRGSDIVKRRLSKYGRNPGKCERCGAVGDMIFHVNKHSFMGFRWKDLSKIDILCHECHDRMHRDDPDDSTAAE